MRLKVKGILMDLDGTLVDSKEVYGEALRKALITMGVKNFNPNLTLEIPRRLEQSLPIEDLMPKVKVEKFLDTYLKIYYKLAEDKSKPLPEVPKTLEILSKRVRLALLTMRYVSKENIRMWLEKFDLAKYFHCIVTALDTSFPKPFPEGLIKCAHEVGVKIGECAIVGDSTIDVRAGKNVGAKTVAVLSGIFTRDELEKEEPDIILNSINELPCFLEFP